MVRDSIDSLASMLTLEQGKPLGEACAEIQLGADYNQWFAEGARRINGDINMKYVSLGGLQASA